jgi:hypothetical protein
VARAAARVEPENKLEFALDVVKAPNRTQQAANFSEDQSFLSEQIPGKEGPVEKMPRAGNEDRQCPVPGV